MNLGLAQNTSARVIICILNWNGWQDTIECLESVRDLRYSNYLTVVVDNGSFNQSLEKLRAWGIEQLQEQGVFVEYRRDEAVRGGGAGSESRLEQCASKQRLVLINNEENLGFTGGCNVVFRYALMRPQRADYVFLVNNDATPEKDCLNHLIQVDQESNAGIVGAVIKSRESGEIFFAGNRGSFPLLREFFFAPPRLARHNSGSREGFSTVFLLLGYRGGDSERGSGSGAQVHRALF